jgi:hypothetical protein
LPELPEGKSKPLKKDLLDHAEKVEVKPDYPTVKIAARRRFTILKAPSYHCELQPIEGLWEIVKKKVGKVYVSHETSGGLKNRLLKHFSEVTPEQLISLWRKSQDICGQYHEANEKDLEEVIDDEDIGTDFDEEELDEVKVYFLYDLINLIKKM